MIAVDTNILVRYITNDDKEQALLATTLLDSYIGKEKSIFINNIVLCELVWVLVRGYKYQKEDIIKTLKLLLSSIEFEFENHENKKMSEFLDIYHRSASMPLCHIFFHRLLQSSI